MTEHLTDAALQRAVSDVVYHELGDMVDRDYLIDALMPVLAAREQALREQIAQAWDNGVVHGRCCPSEFVTTPCLSNPYREGVGGE